MTIIDDRGEIIAIVSGDTAAIQRNTPLGGTAVAEHPPAPDAYWAVDKWRKRPAQPSQYHAWDVDAKSWVDARSLAQVKLARWDAVKESARRANNNRITVDGREFDADDGACAALYRAAQIAVMNQADGQAASVVWTLADNSTATLTAADLKNIVRAIAARSETIRAQASARRAAIAAASTRAQVAAVDWP